jgi:hypothetical protein
MSVSVFPTHVWTDRGVRLCSDWLGVPLAACNKNFCCKGLVVVGMIFRREWKYETKPYPYSSVSIQ